MESFEPDLREWHPWTPSDVANSLRSVRVPWYIAGGWALDLFLGEQTRPHEDLEIGVPASRAEEVFTALRSLSPYVVGGLRAWQWADTSDPMRQRHHQTWMRDEANAAWRLDVFREPERDGQWVARRCSSISLAYGELILRDAAGLPFARPGVVLLFKAKARRPKDEADFLRVLPALSESERAWLRGALQIVHPGHAWLAALA